MNLKAKIASRVKVAGTMMRIVRNPALINLAKNAGLDFVMFDCEHSNYNIETLHDISLLGNALGVACLARVPDLSKDYISRILDAGAEGVMVPMIETVEQAKTLVKYAKYMDVGMRGYTTNGAHTGYSGGGNHSEIMKQANEKVIAIAQIETRLGVDNANEIAAVEGIDVLLIGPNDLSISLGVPGDLMNPVELEAIKKVADACKANGKFFALHAGAKLLDLFTNEIDFVMQGLDNDYLFNGFKGVREYADKVLVK